MALVDDLTAAFPGSRLRLAREHRRVLGEVAEQGFTDHAAHGVILGPIRHRDQFHALRLRFQPFVELFLELPDVDGFELTVQRGDRWLGDTDLGVAAIDDEFFIRTNDEALTQLWLDEPARAALTAQLAAIGPSWRIDLAAGRLAWGRGAYEVSSEQLIVNLELLCTVAGAAGRWAARVDQLARLTGARIKRVVDRIALGTPALVLEQQRTEVTVTYLRTAPGASIARLSTCVTARRSTSVEASWSIVGGAPPGPVGPTSGRKRRAPASLRDHVVRSTREEVVPPYERIVALTAVAGDRVRAVIATESEVSVWFDGAVLDAEPIALAVRLVAELATDAPANVGPYR